MIYKNKYFNREESYNIFRLNENRLSTGRSKMAFTVNVWLNRRSSKIFLGLFDSKRLNGLAISIDAGNGEIEDIFNKQGIIGYLNSTPLPNNKEINCGIEIDKYGNVHLPTIFIGTESLLHPALFIDEDCKLGAYTGSLKDTQSTELKEQKEKSLSPSSPAEGVLVIA